MPGKPDKALLPLPSVRLPGKPAKVFHPLPSVTWLVQ
jgi:hypothetical protein